MFFELLNLGIDLLVFGVLVRLYQTRRRNLEAVKKAPYLKIDQSLTKALCDHGSRTIPYVIIRGTVSAAGPPIRSYHDPSLTGVIQEVIMKEHKTKRNPISCFWSDVETEIKKSTNSVPFCLTDDSWWDTSIQVLEVNKAEKVPLSIVYDHFTPVSDPFNSALFSWIKGERCLGLQEVERMLTEGTLVTAIGELVVDHMEIKLRAPKNGLAYFLTILTPEEVMQKLEKESQTLKSYATIFGCIGLFLASWFYMSWQAKRKREIAKQTYNRRKAEARRRRRKAEEEARARGEKVHLENQPLCVICLTQPVELLVLECGHACMCLECGEQIVDLCPLCRSPITRTVPAFLP